MSAGTTGSGAGFGLKTHHQYGLNLPKPKKPTAAAGKAVARPPIRAFQPQEDDDTEEATPTRPTFGSVSTKRKAAATAALAAADPSIFAYDEVYEEAKKSSLSFQKQAVAKEVAAAPRKSQYIQDLLKQAEFRKTEQDIIHERTLLKERVKDDHQFAGKEKFVTSGYKEKLIEEKKWAERQAAEERRNAARNSTFAGMAVGRQNFLSNILNRSSERGAARAKSKELRSSPQPRSSGGGRLGLCTLPSTAGETNPPSQPEAAAEETPAPPSVPSPRSPSALPGSPSTAAAAAAVPASSPSLATSPPPSDEPAAKRVKVEPTPGDAAGAALSELPRSDDAPTVAPSAVADSPASLPAAPPAKTAAEKAAEARARYLARKQGGK